MNRRLILIVLAFVVAAHALFFLVRWSVLRSGEEKPAVATDVKEESQEEDSDAKTDDALPNTDSPAQLKEDPVAQEKPLDPKADAVPEGALAVGIHRGPTKLSPEVADIAQRGATAVADQDWETARDIYLEMVSKAPDNALAYANLGVAEFQLGNLLAASGNLKRSLDLNDRIGQNWQTLGLIQYEKGDLNLAVASFNRAIHEEPLDAQSRVYLAAVMRDLGWGLEASLIELQRAIEIEPRLPDAHYNLAITYFNLSEPKIELAKRHYYEAIDLGTPPAPEFEKALKTAP